MASSAAKAKKNACNDGAFVVAYALQSPSRIESLRARLDQVKLGDTLPGSASINATKDAAQASTVQEKLPPFHSLDMACTGIGPSAFEQYALLIEKDGIEYLDLTCNNFTLTGDAETQASAVATAAAAMALGSSSGQASMAAAALSAEREKIADGLGKSIWRGVNSSQKLKKLDLRMTDLPESVISAIRATLLQRSN